MAVKPEVQLVKLVKSTDSKRLYVADVDGATWYTQSFFACRTEGNGRDPLFSLLAKYNLTSEPGIFSVNGTVTREEGDPPNVGNILRDVKARKTMVDATRTTLAGRPAFIQASADSVVRAPEVLCALFDIPTPDYAMADSKPVAVNAAFLEYCEEACNVVRWQAADNLKPLAGYNAAGELVAVIMPVRP